MKENRVIAHADFVNRDESYNTMVPVLEITQVGILVDVMDGAVTPKRVATALIPWHRVWNVYSSSELVMKEETDFS